MRVGNESRTCACTQIYTQDKAYNAAIIMDYDTCTYSLGYEMSVRRRIASFWGHGGSNFPSITCTLRDIQYKYIVSVVCVLYLPPVHSCKHLLGAARLVALETCHTDPCSTSHTSSCLSCIDTCTS